MHCKIRAEDSSTNTEAEYPLSVQCYFIVRGEALLLIHLIEIIEVR